MKVKDLKNIIAYMQLNDWDMDRNVDDMTLYLEWEERYRNYTNLINWIYKNKFEAIYGCYDYLRKDR